MNERIRMPHRLRATQGAGARGVALTTALEGEYADCGSVMRDVTILLRSAFINMVGKGLGTKALR